MSGLGESEFDNSDLDGEYPTTECSCGKEVVLQSTIENVQVWNNQGEWMFWVRTKTPELASTLRAFLSNVDLDQ